MWKIVRRRDQLDEEPHWYVDSEDESDARIWLAKNLRCKPEDLKTVAKQPEPKATRRKQ